MFYSTHSTLKWAYEIINKPIVKMSGINHMRQSPTRGAPNHLLINLSTYDRHGQAAQIISMVDRLSDQAMREYITARFGRELGKDNLQVLVYRGCEASGLGLSAQEPVYRIMKSYFVGRLPYRAVRKMLGCRDQYAIMVKSCLYDVLDVIHDRAMADMSEIFEGHGLIESRSGMPCKLITS